jgi:hypothetical protein
MKNCSTELPAHGSFQVSLYVCKDIDNVLIYEKTAERSCLHMVPCKFIEFPLQFTPLLAGGKYG